MPNTPKLSEDVEKDLVGENEHSVYTYCLNGCRTWGVNTPLNNVCGNCNQPDGLVYYDSETITKYVNKELATLKAQVRKEIDGLKKQRLDSPRSFGDGDIVNVASGYNQALLDRKAEEIRKLKEPMEDDEETCLYRHCSEGDHWKCGGDGEGGRCVCRCHALDKALSILKEE